MRRITEELSAEIRGSGFYPPAKGLLTEIRQGEVLELIREADNKYDRNAVKVMLPAGCEAGPGLEETLAGYGITMEEFRERASWMLGHVAKEIAARAAPLIDAAADRADVGYEASFFVRGDGKPCVKITFYEGDGPR